MGESAKVAEAPAAVKAKETHAFRLDFFTGMPRGRSLCGRKGVEECPTVLGENVDPSCRECWVAWMELTS